MKRLSVILSAVLVALGLALPAAASEDAVETRKALMGAVGAAAKPAGAMLKGSMPYNPAVAKASIATMHAAAMAFGDYFPEGTSAEAMDGTTAHPAIWEDRAGFEEQIAAFAEDTAAGLEAAGKNGPADLDAFKAAMGPIFKNCKACHEDWRVEN